MEASKDVLACPHCARQFFATPAVRGMKIRCRGCRLPFRVPAGDPAVQSRGAMPPRLPKATAAVVDGIDVRRCPVCGRAFAMREEFRGKTIRCRQCRNPFLVEADHAAVQGSLADPPRLPPDLPPGQPAPYGLPQAPAVPGPSTVVPRIPADAPVIAEASEDIGDPVDDLDPNEPCPVALPPLVGAPMGRHATGSGVMDVVLIVFGGLAAIPVTLLILWWVFGEDPLRIARMLPETLKWLAPAHLAH